MKRIEVCSGDTRSNLWLPEVELVGPPVDLRVTVGKQDYAIEHTLLQPYPDRISDGAIFNEIHQFIRGRVPNPLPGPVHYQLCVPIEASLPRGRKNREQALESLLEWIVSTAQKLHERRREVPLSTIVVNNFIKGKPEYFDQNFELFRWPDGLQTPYTPGALSMAFCAPEDFKQPLKHSMSKAFAKKFPKLHECKKLGARTILVLEGLDLPVGHHKYIGKVLPDLLAQRADRPDEIYLVEPNDGSIRWWVWPLKRDEDHWPVAGLPTSSGSFFSLGERPSEEMSEWYRQLNGPLGVSQHIPLEWHPAFFEEEELSDLTRGKDERSPDRSMR